ncbi:MAG TPA: fluoride efflux transporter CrcB, partial [Candidatus Saccharimonadia bacterium]|nr:fluoride efflux transporter CrcB [Candidatus Saccharimonadia bacterium]
IREFPSHPSYHPMLKTYLMVMLGGCMGVAARVWLSMAIASVWGGHFPAGTVTVNITGCFVIGLFAIITEPGGLLPASPLIKQAVILGILGGFTTFSSFSIQTIELLKHGQLHLATLNVVLSVVGCLLATWVGMMLGGWMNGK